MENGVYTVPGVITEVSPPRSILGVTCGVAGLYW